MSNLFTLLNRGKSRSTAIVGMTKNVGKTVTFNYLVKHFSEASTIIGILSSGYDGERFDRLTLKSKPKIIAPRGTYLATAKACFDTADAKLQLVEETSLSTPLGPVCIGHVAEMGYVELAGPGSVSDLKRIAQKIYSLGAEHVLIDGAINRLASASPQVTESTILATGASLGPTMDDVIRKTVFRQTIFTTPLLADIKLKDAAREGLKKGQAAIIRREGDGYRFEPASGAIPLIAGNAVAQNASPGAVAIVLGGAVVDSIITGLMENCSDLPLIVVQDATRIFISPGVFYPFIKKGGRFAVMHKLDLVAVTVNPTDPSGRDYDPKMFWQMMQEALEPCPVFDLVWQSADL